MAKVNLRCYFFIIILIQFFTPCYSQQNTFSHNAQDIEALTTKIDSLMTAYNIPGAGIAIVSKGSLFYRNGLGYANIEAKIPMNENTLFRVGSITKSFVALGILKLVEHGHIDLQTPVKQILPDIEIDNPWDATHPIRVIHLLEHTAGLNDPHFNDYYLDGDPGVPLREGLKVSEHYLKVKWRPGAYRSYSSAGFMLAGIILEKVSGQNFEDYLKKEILEPIGMTKSQFRLTPEIEESMARGYKAHYQQSQIWHTYSRPAGSMISSASELALFLQFMLNKGRIGEQQFFAESTINRMERSATDPAAAAGLESNVGLGIGISHFKGFKWYVHYGSIMGFCGAYGYCRDIDVGCVILTNRWDVDFETGIIKLWNTLRDYLVKDFDDLPQKPAEPVIPDDLLKTYTGYYKWCNPPQQLSAWIDLILNYQIIKFKDSQLSHKSVFFGSWEPLIPVTQNSFREDDEFHASKVFIQTPDNNIAFIDNDSFYLQTSRFQPYVHGYLFFISWIVMLSSIFYAIVWIPIDLFKRITNKESRSQYLRIRVIPLLAVLIIIVSFTLVGMQVSKSLAYIGQKTPVNIFFYISTWHFAILSFISLFFTIKSFRKPVKTVARIYALLLSLSCVAVTLYWAYWGVIGLKLWAY